MTNNNQTKFRVLHKAAPKASKRYGNYRRVAVVEVTDAHGPDPKLISKRARNCERVVKTWEDLYDGSTSECAFQEALRAANDLCERLNG